MNGEPGGPCSSGECDEALGHVWEVLDGELDESNCERIRAHVAECETCAGLYHSQRVFKTVVARACGCERAPEDLTTRVTARIAELRVELTTWTVADPRASDERASEPRGSESQS